MQNGSCAGTVLEYFSGRSKGFPMKLACAAALLSVLAVQVQSSPIDAAYSGSIANLQQIASNAYDNRSQGYTIFTIPGTADGNCVEFWLSPVEKSLLAVLLSAKISGAEVRVTGRTETLPPWGTLKSCRADQILIP
jgi:hypothetical protein